MDLLFNKTHGCSEGISTTLKRLSDRADEKHICCTTKKIFKYNTIVTERNDGQNYTNKIQVLNKAELFFKYLHSSAGTGRT